MAQPKLTVESVPTKLTFEETNTVIKVEAVETRVITLVSEGPQGPRGLQGLPGTGGDLHYTHTQMSPSAIWVVTHNLAKLPSVSVVDSSGDTVFGDVNYMDLNSLTITFAAGFSGRAALN